MPKVVVVGCGVLGLSTAWAIKEHQPQTTVLVIGKAGPHVRLTNLSMTNDHHYTSPWAGAHFRPFPLKTKQEWTESQFTRATQRRLRKLAITNPELSVQFIDGIEYFEAPDQFYRELAKGYREEMEGFEVLPAAELPEGVTMGVKYRTWAINLPLYLQWLYRKLFYEYQVDFIEAELTSLRNVNDYVSGNPIIVNCSGMGLMYDGGYDPECYPIRGQTLLVRPPCNNRFAATTVTHQLKEGLWTFCIPRPLDGGMIIGGTKQVGDTYDGVRDDDTHQLLTRGQMLFPELSKNGKFDVVNINVGFRPARNGGLNTLMEPLQQYPQRQNHVINNYGAGGMGYELSYGLGLQVVEHLRYLVRANKL
ncbi:FAD-binding oxidoreductase [Kocuria palustris]|nr:FAD-binding oxidoreductase [Kocuria palustris]